MSADTDAAPGLPPEDELEIVRGVSCTLVTLGQLLQQETGDYKGETLLFLGDQLDRAERLIEAGRARHDAQLAAYYEKHKAYPW